MPPIKTIRRRKWHRPGDRWQWDGFILVFSGPKRPVWRSFPRPGRWECQACYASDEIAPSNNNTERRLSLRKIAPAGRKG